jgi:hypothetical protein
MVLKGADRPGIEPFLLGFATMHFKDKILFLDLLCGNKNYKGIGTALIEAIKELSTQVESMKLEIKELKK